MMVADTGAMLALLDGSDEHHPVIKELYEENAAGWILPSIILPEVDYLLATHLGGKAQDAFLADKSESYLRRLSDFLTSINKTSSEIWDLLQESPQYCENDLCAIVDRTSYGALFEGFGRFQALLLRLQKVIDPEKFAESRKRHDNLTEVMAIHLETASAFSNSFQIWVVSAKKELSARRKELSEIASRRG